MASKGAFNIQDQVLNQARKHDRELTVDLMAGERFKAKVKSFDAFVIMFDINGEDVMVYKHNVAMVNCGAKFLQQAQQRY